MPAHIEASRRSSENRKQGEETALGTHTNGCVSFAETVEKMAREDNGRHPTFWELFNRTHKRTGKDSQEMCSQRATEIEEQVYARADALRATGVENIDYDAIFVELFGKVKKRKQIPGAGQATSIYFPFATSSSTPEAPSAAGVNPDEVKRRVQEMPDQVRIEVTNEVQERMQLVMQEELAKVCEAPENIIAVRPAEDAH